MKRKGRKALVLLDLLLNLSKATVGSIARLNDQSKRLLHFSRHLGRVVVVTDGALELPLVDVDTFRSSNDIAWFENAVREFGLVVCSHFLADSLLKTEAAVFGLRIPYGKSFFKGVYSMRWNLSDRHNIVESGAASLSDLALVLCFACSCLSQSSFRRCSLRGHRLSFCCFTFVDECDL